MMTSIDKAAINLMSTLVLLQQSSHTASCVSVALAKINLSHALKVHKPSHPIVKSENFLFSPWKENWSQVALFLAGECCERRAPVAGDQRLRRPLLPGGRELPSPICSECVLQLWASGSEGRGGHWAWISTRTFEWACPCGMEKFPNVLASWNRRVQKSRGFFYCFCCFDL